MIQSEGPRIQKGDKLGPYEVIRLIGKGGMGEVFLAKDTALDRPVALKIVKSKITGDVETQRRFKQEGKALARLRHPFLVNVFGVGEDKGIAYLAMEYIEGLSLASYLEHGTFGVGEALHLIMQILEGIGAAHKAGVIHRDLKPVNIIVDEDHRIKIIDFGIARVLDSQQTEQTAVGTVMGTVHYMAPEVVRGQGLSPQTDIYAIGVVFYEMLTGQRPFNGTTSLEIIEKIKMDPITFPESTRDIIPIPIQELILKMTAKDVVNRYQSAADVVHDIQHLQLSDWPTELKSVWPRCDLENEAEVRVELERRGFAPSEYSLIIHLAWQIQVREGQLPDETLKLAKEKARLSMAALNEGVARYRQARIRATESKSLSMGARRERRRAIAIGAGALVIVLAMISGYVYREKNRDLQPLTTEAAVKSEVIAQDPSQEERSPAAETTETQAAPVTTTENAEAIYSDVNPNVLVKAFRGEEGERLIMLFLDPPGEYQRLLIKYSRMGGPLDGKLVRHTLRNYDGKQDYRLDGEDYVTVSKRNGRYEAWPKGSLGPIAITYDEAESNRLHPGALLREYLGSN